MGTKVNSNYEDLLTFTRASKGHALRPVSYGDELVTNGDFSSTDITDWDSFDASLAVVSGELELTYTNATQYVWVEVSTTPNAIYNFSIDCRSDNAVGHKLTAYSDGFPSGTEIAAEPSFVNFASSLSTKTLTVKATTSTTLFMVALQLTSGKAYFDNVSVKEVLFDQPDGTLTLFEHPENVPRVEWDADGNRLGLLVEESRTNLVTYSEDFTQSFYIKDANVSVTSSNNAAPSGVSNASLITASDNGRIYANNASLTGVVSVFVKAGTFANLKIKGNNVDLVAKTASAGTLEEVGGGWFRYTSEEATAARHFQIQAYPDDTYSSHTQTGTYYIWGAQLEAGSFPTSYIKNEGTTSGVTRSADVASIPVADFGFNTGAGTFVAEFDFTDPQNDDHNYVISGGSDARIIYNNASQSAWRAFDGVAGVSYGSLDNTGASRFKAAVAVNESANDTATFLDGNLASTRTLSFSLMTNLKGEDLNIGNGFSSGQKLNGHIKSIKYYPRRLTNAQLQEITS